MLFFFFCFTEILSASGSASTANKTAQGRLSDFKQDSIVSMRFCSGCRGKWHEMCHAESWVCQPGTEVKVRGEETLST